MRNLHAILALVLAAALAAAAGAGDGDKEKLQGRWLVTSMVSKGQKLETPPGKKVILTFFVDGKLVSEGGDKGRQEGTYQIDSSKKPKQIDMTKNKDQISGLYSLEGDMLKIALPLPTQKKAAEKPQTIRPSAMEGDDVLTVTLQRQKN